jgi:hypothetical protein
MFNVLWRITIREMPPSLRRSFIFAIAGVVLSLASLTFFRGSAGLLCFYFAGLWILWIVCSVVTSRFQWAPMIGLWVLIDLGVLIDFLSIALAIPKAPHPVPLGLEFVALIAYFPVAIPLGLIVPQWLLLTSAGMLFNRLGPVGADIIDAWIGMTVIAARHSTLIAVVVCTVRQFVRRKRTHAVDT